jgi:hypothetical protein
MKKVIGLGLAGALAIGLLAGPTLAAASPRDSGSRDVHKSGSWGAANYTLDLSTHQTNRIESDLNVHHAVNGQKWTITMKDNGVKFFRGTRTVRSGEFEAVAYAPNKAGTDTIKVTASHGGKTYSTTAKL